MKRRHLILLLGGASSGAMSVGTGAFSSMDAERGVEMNIAKDENAYLGYLNPSDGERVTDGDSITLVTVTNRFAGRRIGVVGAHVSQGGHVVENVRVEEKTTDDEFEPVNEELATDADFENREVSESESFDTGERVHIRADIVDGAVDVEESIDIAVTVGVTGYEGGISARVFGDTRTFTLTIEEDDGNNDAGSVSGVQFKSGNSGILIETSGDGGSSTAETSSDDGEDELRALAYYEDGNAVRRTNEADVASNETLKLKNFGDDLDSGRRIVGIEIEDIDGVYDRRTTTQSGNSDNWSGFTVTTVALEAASFYDQLDD